MATGRRPNGQPYWCSYDERRYGEIEIDFPDCDLHEPDQAKELQRSPSVDVAVLAANGGGMLLEVKDFSNSKADEKEHERTLRRLSSQELWAEKWRDEQLVQAFVNSHHWMRGMRDEQVIYDFTALFCVEAMRATVNLDTALLSAVQDDMSQRIRTSQIAEHFVAATIHTEDTWREYFPEYTLTRVSKP